MHENSEVIFFCHGAPGSAQDADLLKPLDADTVVIAPNMLNASSGGIMAHMIEAFDRAASAAPGARINVVGFSVGAMVAIKIAAARSDKVARLILISPAAPLKLGDFLSDMAGKPIFELAIKHPKILKALTGAQAVLSRVVPNILINQLFQKCGKMEQALLSDEKFRDVLKSSFKNSFRRYPRAYVDLLQLYVTDWSADIDHVNCPVEIWHGDKDTWSPIAMSHVLSKAFPNTPKLHVVKNAEHYSTLTRAVLSP